jgi:hypothetical protein
MPNARAALYCKVDNLKVSGCYKDFSKLPHLTDL